MTRGLVDQIRSTGRRRGCEFDVFGCISCSLWHCDQPAADNLPCLSPLSLPAAFCGYSNQERLVPLCVRTPPHLHLLLQLSASDSPSRGVTWHVRFLFWTVMWSDRSSLFLLRRRVSFSELSSGLFFIVFLFLLCQTCVRVSDNVLACLFLCVRSTASQILLIFPSE